MAVAAVPTPGPRLRGGPRRRARQAAHPGLARGFKQGDFAFCLTEADQLAYEYGHHNWFEKGSATHDGVVYSFEMIFQNQQGLDWNDTLVANSADDDSTLWGPVDLSYADCWTIPEANPNFCLARPPVDL
jgi:hypothetical protein